MKAKTTAKRLEKIFGSKVKKASDGCAQTIDSADELAKRIATEILTVGASGKPVRCNRAVMMRGKYPDGERNMGGRNAASIAFVVKEHLLAAGYTPNDLKFKASGINLQGALRRSIKLTDSGKFSGGVSVAGHVIIGKRRYEVTVKVECP
jgi:hypothetical protein